jgi:hypothetical protein
MKTINNQAELRNLVCTVIDSAELKFDQGSDYSEPIRKKLTILMTCYAMDWIRFGLDLTDRDGIFTINGEDKNGVALSFKSHKALFKFIDPFFSIEAPRYLLAKEALCEVFAAKNLYDNNKLFHELKVLAERKAGENLLSHFLFVSSTEKLNAEQKICEQENIEIIEIKNTQETSLGRQKYQWRDGKYRLVSGDNVPYFAEIFKITYKIKDFKHRAYIVQITPESLLLWQKTFQYRRYISAEKK